MRRLRKRDADVFSWSYPRRRSEAGGGKGVGDGNAGTSVPSGRRKKIGKRRKKGIFAHNPLNV